MTQFVEEPTLAFRGLSDEPEEEGEKTEDIEEPVEELEGYEEVL